jgi:hypothetical protein
MLYEQDMNEEAYRDGSGTDLWIGSDRIWHPELQMRSASIWDMTPLPYIICINLSQGLMAMELWWARGSVSMSPMSVWNMPGHHRDYWECLYSSRQDHHLHHIHLQDMSEQTGWIHLSVLGGSHIAGLCLISVSQLVVFQFVRPRWAMQSEPLQFPTPLISMWPQICEKELLLQEHPLLAWPLFIFFLSLAFYLYPEDYVCIHMQYLFWLTVLSPYLYWLYSLWSRSHSPVLYLLTRSSARFPYAPSTIPVPILLYSEPPTLLSVHDIITPYPYCILGQWLSLLFTLTLLPVSDSVLSLPAYLCTTTYGLVCAWVPYIYQPCVSQLYSLTWIYLVLHSYLVHNPWSLNCFTCDLQLHSDLWSLCLLITRSLCCHHQQIRL